MPFVKNFFQFLWCRGSELNRHSLLPQQVFYHLNYHDRLSGFCSRYIPNIVSARGVWFTLIYRNTYTPCGRIVGQRSYRLSWVFPFGTALPSPFVPLLYHNLGGLSRGFYIFFKNLKVLLQPNGEVLRAQCVPPLDTTDYSTSTPRLQ